MGIYLYRSATVVGLDAIQDTADVGKNPLAVLQDTSAPAGTSIDGAAVTALDPDQLNQTGLDALAGIFTAMNAVAAEAANKVVAPVPQLTDVWLGAPDEPTNVAPINVVPESVPPESVPTRFPLLMLTLFRMLLLSVVDPSVSPLPMPPLASSLVTNAALSAAAPRVWPV